MKFINYTEEIGKNLTGNYIITRKLDGVRVSYNSGAATSRTGKVLYNLPPGMPDGEYECMVGSFKDTISLLKTKVSDKKVPKDRLFQISPKIDPRIIIEWVDFSKDIRSVEGYIAEVLLDEVLNGFEGLVLHPADKSLPKIKVKPTYTYDVVVTGITEGKGKNKGKIGALITAKGKVGTGLTDEDRVVDAVGKTIEVECMQLTENGKFRHPRFIRWREDKDE